MTTPIRAALTPSSRLGLLIKDGIQALARSHHVLIAEEIRGEFADSLDIDEAFRKGHDQEHRWDYLLGHGATGELVALEPHSASNKEVSTVINKRAAALRHLRGHLKPGARVKDWLWVASGTVDFTPMEKAIVRLNNNGIRFVGKALLAKALPQPVPKVRRTKRK